MSGLSELWWECFSIFLLLCALIKLWLLKSLLQIVSCVPSGCAFVLFIPLWMMHCLKRRTWRGREKEREKASYPLPLINPLCCRGPVIHGPDFCPFSCWTSPFIFLLIHLCSPPLLFNAGEDSGWSSSKGQPERPLPTPQGFLSKAQTTSGMWPVDNETLSYLSTRLTP